ncbi:MAG: hypothetical protein IT348_18425 [Candidatus Eisenbacteria bacterium]|nr:hypothetical protein [Candidatus Eisenbacteria bacterium]
MNDLSAVIQPATWALAVLSLVVFALIAARPSRAGRLLAVTALLWSALLLAGALLLPAWIPAGASLVHADGSTGDPRVISALLVGLAALFSLLPGVRSLRIHAIGQVGFWLPGVVIGALVGAGAYFAGLQHAVALAGLVLGGAVLGTAVNMVIRQRGDNAGVSAALLAGCAALVVISAMLALHGARAQKLALEEGGSLDTLGTRVTFVATEAPHDSLRRMKFALSSSAGVDTVWAELRGRAGADRGFRAAGTPFGALVLVPVALEERQVNPHGISWIRKGETVGAGDAQVKFVKFRFEMGDTIRLYADLEVTRNGKTQSVSPGAIANSKGEVPFPAEAEGLGPIAIAGVDADNARVGLVLPAPTQARVVRTAVVDLRLRPSVRLAGIGAAIAVLAFFLAIGFTREERPSAV